MGKKSRRNKPNNQKKTVASSTTSTGGPATDLNTNLEDNLIQLYNTFCQLSASQDYEGIWKLESETPVLAIGLMMNMLEKTFPVSLHAFYHTLASAHKALGREGGTEQAIVYYEKSIEMATKHNGTEPGEDFPVIMCLADSYVKIGRAEAAMELYKNVCCTRVGGGRERERERIDPDHVLAFADTFKRHHEDSRAIEMLEEHLDIIESAWDKDKQGIGYGRLADSYWRRNEYHKAIRYREKQLSIAKEDTKDVQSEYYALQALGRIYGSLGDREHAMNYLEQALALVSEVGDINKEAIAKTHAAIGDLLIAMNGYEMEAIEAYQQCCDIYPEAESLDEGALSFTFSKLGLAFEEIGAWDDAIAAHRRSISTAESIQDEETKNQCQGQAHQAMGHTYLEQYCTDERLIDIPLERDEILRKAAYCTDTAIYNYYKKAGVVGDAVALLDLAQVQYYLGYIESAQEVLVHYLDTILSEGPLFCLACKQTSGKDAIMRTCGGCNVAHYCCRPHQKQTWKKGRLCHRAMCPLFKRWRRVKKGKDTAESCIDLFNNFFDNMLVAERFIEEEVDEQEQCSSDD